MESLKPGDKVCPITAMGVTAVKEVSGIVVRMKYITAATQPLDQADGTPNYIFKSAQARQLAESLIKAADIAMYEAKQQRNRACLYRPLELPPPTQSR